MYTLKDVSALRLHFNCSWNLNLTLQGVFLKILAKIWISVQSVVQMKRNWFSVFEVCNNQAVFLSLIADLKWGVFLVVLGCSYCLAFCRSVPFLFKYVEVRLKLMILNNTVARRPGISRNLEKSGILWHLKNVREKSGNFVKFRKVREF